MSSHPIEGLMTTAMQSIKEMVDVNTIVGDAVQAPDGTVIIPISKVSFGFAAGGGDYGEDSDSNNSREDKSDGKFPFAGGSGAGVSINPVAFMVCGQNHVKLLPVNVNSSVEKILDMVPELVQKANEMINEKMSKSKSDNCKQKKEENEKGKE
ncbi:GerW family sporulation protein [Ruminiclostridium cellulolyticum]|uniref:Sporulation protein YtfJ n=1 Tax=Ruminiclostridium cellulolyticum (strain ATCC 35319 / DSM 5812 / JCM 6584 / H10) TaxID=394503 RepID=B8I2V2_RUMCH|nr:GerW family sporulation protein [Ruminiclostridium cellulolyticum]ACL76095.1 sporulation protein YtfJ [Ruminiclostridium cellulolyticum H10]